MADSKVPPRIFVQAVLQKGRERASKRAASFLIDRAAQDASERLCDINRTFDTALILGAARFKDSLIGALPDSKRPADVTQGNLVETANGVLITDLDGTSVDPRTFDLVISGLTLQSTNDLPGALFEARKALKPDGLFIGAMFGGETLTELRQALYAADEALFGGITARIYPFADYSQAAALLQQVGYALPVVDADRFSVSYKAFQTLIDDLRDLGETNCLTARQHRYAGKAYRQTLQSSYAEHFSNDGKFQATFEILWLTGWAPHDSQQKPLKPGSAKMRLADALGQTEKRL